MENSSSTKKREFNESLAELIELATVSGNRLSREQIKLYFKDIIEDDDKYEYIYKYLRELKIEIDGENDDTMPKTEAVGRQETDEAKAFFDMYIKELDELETDGGCEKEELIRRMKNGDRQAGEMLTHMYLAKVVDIAEEYLSGPLGKSDLVAEGNLALFEANIEYSGEANIKEYEKYICDRIRRGMESAAFEEMGSDRTSKHMLQRINALNDASTELAEQLGREATLAELSEKLALSEDEIRELMKVSIDALTVDEGAQ